MADPLSWAPRYHITAERNWLNDPNGAIYINGRYHLFYQYYPEAPAWGPPRWAHVSSPDLIRWRRHPLALEPEPGGPDRDGCWSGCLRIIDGTPAIYYTGVIGDDSGRVESICRARGAPDLSTWVKDPGNPLVPAPPAALGSAFHRDPFVWKDSNGWHLLLGSGRSRPRDHGCLVIYHSADATSWRYGGVFLDGSGLASALDLGGLWECPQLIQLGEAAVLLLSCQDPDAPEPFLHTAYLVGHLDRYRFRPSSTGLLDHGDAFYAATAGQDSEGRPLIFGWARETIPAAKAAKMARVGALTLPRTLHLDGNHVKTIPAPQLTGLRASAPRTAGAPGQSLAVGAQFEVHASIGGTSGGASIAFRPPGEPPLTVTVDMSRRTLEARSAQRTMQAPISAASDGSRILQVYGDGSLIEIFFGDETALTTRWYRAAAHCEVAAHPTPGDSVSQVTAWDLISNT